MKFKNFADYLQKISTTAGRTEMTIIVAELLKELTLSGTSSGTRLGGDEVKYAMYLIQGRLVPKFVALEFNISQKLILRALGDLIQDEKKAKTLYQKLGDAGLVAQEIIENHQKYLQSKKVELLGEEKQVEYKDKNLNITEVYKQLEVIAKLAGKGSQEGKMQNYTDLILAVDAISAKFVTRIMVGSLRLGISEKTILDSLSWYKTGDKSLRGELDYAFGKKADIGELAEKIIDSDKSDSRQSEKSKDQDIKQSEIAKEKALSDFQKVLNELKVQPGIPVASKLVEREKNAQAVWERMPQCFIQPKLDGLRGQLHYNKKGLGMLEAKSAIFSRNMETMTDQFPELTKSLEELNVDSIILDSEIIGVREDKVMKIGIIDSEQNTQQNKSKSPAGHPSVSELVEGHKSDRQMEYLTYQETMQRRRKYDIGEFSKNIPVRSMCFDILYLNGEDLTQKPIEERIEILRKVLADSTSSLRLLETKQAHSEKELEEYFTSKVNSGLEGIITKQLGTNYDPGTRNFKWIKLKANTRTDLVDTIDVVVLGYYIGRGDRSRFGFGALLAGVYDPKEDKYYSIGKVGSGFTEEVMGQIFKDLKEIKITDKPDNVIVDKMLFPDVWVKPQIIMEIIADEITRSPNHTAARGIKAKVAKDDPEKGLSIRFPRMKIWNREDKSEPNSVDEIVRMYELRKGE